MIRFSLFLFSNRLSRDLFRDEDFFFAGFPILKRLPYEAQAIFSAFI